MSTETVNENTRTAQDAPERIWAEVFSSDFGGGISGVFDQVLLEGDVEYIRADLVPTWRPIGTAPNDEVFLAIYRDGVFTAIMCKGEVFKCDPDGFGIFSFEEFVTHWMRLPKPPQVTS